MQNTSNSFSVTRTKLPGTDIDYYPLNQLIDLGISDHSHLPITIKIFLENLLRNFDKGFSSKKAIMELAKWDGKNLSSEQEFAYLPSRVLLQDFTGVPVVVDLAAMRDAMVQNGGDPNRVNPVVNVDLVIDHSVQVDAFRSPEAYGRNIEHEYERNGERYSLLRWAQQAFNRFRVVPPGMGIVHQVNLEYLSTVVQVQSDIKGKIALPDTVVGTDSHTPMVNGIGVLAWGVGGIEAEAVMLGQPLFLLSPIVVGVALHNQLPPGVTATDLVLTVTERLRKHGVVNKFVEFCGDGVATLTAADRATMANMAPEYGATAALFGVDDATLKYLRESGRTPGAVSLVENYSRAQGMFADQDWKTITFSEVVEIDLAQIEPSVAGPLRPQDRVTLPNVWRSFQEVFPDVDNSNKQKVLTNGSVVIAAITSCTNTSNPVVMVGAGLLAKKAVEAGLKVPDYVKTSLAPGSRVVTGYLEKAGLTEPLSQLGFELVGYGCTTCIGNSGPLPDEVSVKVDNDNLVVVAVLSGNRNFEGRIHPQVRASYLASPPLVVAYALAGTVNVDLSSEPLGYGRDGQAVFLQDIWPSSQEINQAIHHSLAQNLFTTEYAQIFDGDEHWQKLPSPQGQIFAWENSSTYVKQPPYFENFSEAPQPPDDVIDARVLAMVGDSITTDHISPAGAISPTSPAGEYLQEHGVAVLNFNTYGARRGNHEVMLRGTFANIRLRNQLAKDKVGGFTIYFPSGEVISIYDATRRYLHDKTPLIILAGKEYGSGSSRDWAAKGPALLGVRAVIAESYERIHRSNLVGMGVLPLQYKPGENAQVLGLDGTEVYSIKGISDLEVNAEVKVVAINDQGRETTFSTLARIDSITDLENFRNGGIMPLVVRQLLAQE